MMLDLACFMAKVLYMFVPNFTSNMYWFTSFFNVQVVSTYVLNLKLKTCAACLLR